MKKIITAAFLLIAVASNGQSAKHSPHVVDTTGFLAEDSAGRTYFVHGKKMAPAPMILEQRVTFLEKQVQFLIRRTTELEQEIKALKPDSVWLSGNGRMCNWSQPDTTK
jgi:hypothetical protein